MRKGAEVVNGDGAVYRREEGGPARIDEISAREDRERETKRRKKKGENEGRVCYCSTSPRWFLLCYTFLLVVALVTHHLPITAGYKCGEQRRAGSRGYTRGLRLITTDAAATSGGDARNGQ